MQSSDPNADFVIESGSTWVLPSSGSIQARKITVRGILACSPDSKPEDFLELVAASIIIDGGVFQCSKSLDDTTNPYNGQLKVIINDVDQPVINVMNHGKLFLRGQNEKRSWGRIASTVNSGDQKVVVSNSYKWRVGDEVVIAPSDYDYTEYEHFKITEIVPAPKPGFVSLTLDRPAKFLHYGKEQQFEVGKRTLISRAEIALLTRSIQLYGDCEKFQQTKKGISMSFRDAALAQIDNVEIRCAGHADVMGGYPIHFHNLGMAKGNVFSGSSIYKSSNRCLSVHCSDEVLIDRNACIDHVGHGYFLEDGSESGNVFQFNLGVTTHPGSGLLNPTDVVPEQRGEAAGVSTFWSAATNNTFFHNTAAGSAWMGFAFDGRDDILSFIDKTSICKTRYKNFPWDIKSGVLGLQEGFVAHSTRGSGYWIDGYAPNRDYFASRFHVYKTQESGIHMGFNRMLITNFTVSDTQKGLWSTFSSTFRNGVVVGRSALSRVGRHSPFEAGKYFGMFVYDGPAIVYDVSFFNFDTPDSTKYEVCHFELNGGGRASGKHLLAGLTFKNPERPVFCKKNDFQPKLWDLDGSMTGVPGSFVSNVMSRDQENGGFDVLINDGSCKYMPGTNDQQIVCGPNTLSSYLNLHVKDVQPEDKPFRVSHNGNGQTRQIPLRGGPFNDYEVYVRPNTTYHFAYNGNVRCFGFDMYDMFEHDWYHLVFKRNDGSALLNIQGENLSQAASKEELFTSSESKQFLENNELHVVIRKIFVSPFYDQNGNDFGLARSFGKLCF